MSKTLDQINDEIQVAQIEKDNAIKRLKLLIAERDAILAETEIKRLVDGMSKEQREAMYGQLVGVKQATSIGIAKDGK